MTMRLDKNVRPRSRSALRSS